MSIALAAFATAPVAAKDEIDPDYEWEADILHSDLPLYSTAWRELWPRSLDLDDIRDTGSFGCKSRVRFGDWQFKPHELDEFSSASWLRVENYGVLTCVANLDRAYEREELGEASFGRGYFIRLGQARKNGRDWDLWALQEGFVPGSDYTLLAREPSEDAVTQFTVLQVRCPRSRIRKIGISEWLTRYCSINSRRDLLGFARKMLKHPPLGTLTLVPNEKGPEGKAPDPSNSPPSE